jgi:hypothetical protein
VRVYRAGVLLVVFWGCGDAPSAPTVQVSDSAGVRVVQHAEAVGAPRWRADTSSATWIGRRDGIELFGVTAAVQAADGRTIVADAGSRRILFFDRQGLLEGTAGGEGEGPGEFKDISFLSLTAADSLLVWDRRLRRVSLLSSMGSFARSFTLEATDSVPFASIFGVYTDGSLAATGFVDTGGAPITTGRKSYQAPVYHFGPEGEFLGFTGQFSTGESYFESLNGAFRVGPALFGAAAFRQVAGRRLLTVRGEVGELRFQEPDGRLGMIVRGVARAQAVTQDAKAKEIARLVDEAPTSEREWLRGALTSMDTPATTPALRSIFVDRGGYVWLEPFQPGKGSGDVRWLVLGPDGTLNRSVDLPGNFKLMDAGEAFVVGVAKDELGVESVMRAEIARF